MSRCGFVSIRLRGGGGRTPAFASLRGIGKDLDDAAFDLTQKAAHMADELGCGPSATDGVCRIASSTTTTSNVVTVRL